MNDPAAYRFAVAAIVVLCLSTTTVPALAVPVPVSVTAPTGEAVIPAAEEPTGTVVPPGAPTWVSPTARAVTSPCTVRLHAGASTVAMTLIVGGRRMKTVACRPGGQVTFTGVKLASHVQVLSVEALSTTGETGVFTRRVARFEFPYATCIIIDKSQYLLYWVKNQQVVKRYAIAHGRYDWTPVGVWKVLAKYRTAPRGIYGPRKMRMFRRVGKPGHYRYVFTRYAIHGTNQPWVIGTQASHGCIRMYNRDVLGLWPQVPIGTMVITRA